MFGVIHGSKQKLCMHLLFYSNYYVYLYCSHLLNIYFSFCRAECYDYLFDIALQMKQNGLNPLATPENYELKYQKNETMK